MASVPWLRVWAVGMAAGTEPPVLGCLLLHNKLPPVTPQTTHAYPVQSLWSEPRAAEPCVLGPPEVAVRLSLGAVASSEGLAGCRPSMAIPGSPASPRAAAAGEQGATWWLLCVACGGDGSSPQA